jgi:hypothetical protein
MQMADAAHIADGLHIGEETGGFNRAIDDNGLVAFLAAGAVLFASLVVGSAASLMLVGSDALMAAILRGFLSLGMWMLGAFVAATLAAIAVAMARRRASGMSG